MAVFQHPRPPQPQPVEQLAMRQEAQADLGRWLAAFFNSSAGRLTSTRLQERRAAWEAATAGQAVEAPPPEDEEPSRDRLVVPEGEHCDPECLRRVAEQLIVTDERHGEPLKLHWPVSQKDAERWAAVQQPAWGGWRGSRPGPPQGACQLRRPGETITKDFLVIAAVGNNWTTIDG
jgi:hypothetical protein